MKILILSNSSGGLYNLKRELIEELLKPNSYVDENRLGVNDIYVVIPDDKKSKELNKMGCKVKLIPLQRRGTNPIQDFKILVQYFNIMKKIKPDVVLTFTIKPNIYGGIISSLLKVPYIANVTGLGSSIRDKSVITGFVETLYSIGLKNSNKIYFENSSDLDFFNDNILNNNKSLLLPGSGINVNRFPYRDYPIDNGVIKFLTIGRIMKDKGSDELLKAAAFIKSKYDNVEFYLAGDYDEYNYKDMIIEYDNKGIINYLGYRSDISELIANSNAIIHPSYHEGLSNVLLEAGAVGRPVIASNVPGCRETFIEGKTGISIEPRSTESLVHGIEEFINLDYKKKIYMGLEARKHVYGNFDRKIVIQEYVDTLNNLNISDYY